MKNRSLYCAEVTESSLSSIKAEIWPEKEAPSYGALVAIDQADSVVFGLVYASFSHTDEVFRNVAAYQKTEEELRAEQPQVFAFLKRSLRALIVGVDDRGKISHSYTSRPLALHSFVRPASSDECHNFFTQAYYVALVCEQASLIGSVDELFLNVIKNMKRHQVSDAAYEELIDYYSLLNGNDYRRLKSFLYRVQQII